MKQYKSHLLCFIAGILYALGFPNSLVPTTFLPTFIGVALLFHSLGINREDKFKKNDLLLLLAFSLGYCLMGYYWVAQVFYTFGELPWIISWMLGLMFSLIIVPQYLVALLTKHHLYKFFSKFKFQRNLSLLSIAFILTFLETFIPQQFPAHVGHTWLSMPKLYFAPILGAPFYSFISYWLILSLIDFYQTKKAPKLALISFALFFGVNFISNPNNSYQEKTDRTDIIRIVQANIGNYIKISSERGDKDALDNVLGNYYNLSTRESFIKPDLIVWPETAFPMLINSRILKLDPETIPPLIERTIADSGTEIFFGGYDQAAAGDYNAAFHVGIDRQLKDVYHKRKLIPFGESLPFGPLNQLIKPMIANMAFFKEGERLSLFKTVNETPFIASICYELLFSNHMRGYLNHQKTHPNFIINLTNDSWYGDTDEPEQHLFLAKWRALEFGLPIVRSTNTGISSVIYPDGSESKRLNIGDQDILDITLKTKSNQKPTVYQRFGFLGTVFVFFILAGLVKLQDLLLKGRGREENL